MDLTQAQAQEGADQASDMQHVYNTRSDGMHKAIACAIDYTKNHYVMPKHDLNHLTRFSELVRSNFGIFDHFESFQARFDLFKSHYASSSRPNFYRVLVVRDNH